MGNVKTLEHGACRLFFYALALYAAQQLLQGEQSSEALAHHHDGYGSKQQACEL